MSIDRTQMRIDIRGFQRVLSMITSDPGAVLMIESKRAVLSISGEFAWNVYGAENIANVLEQAAEKFSVRDTDEPVEPK